MYTLAINLSHHASIALSKDDKLIYFLEEERLSRIKYSVEILEGNDYLLSTTFSKKLFNLNILKSITSHIENIIFVHYMSSESKDHLNTINKIIDELTQSEITYNNLFFQNEHHLYHALSGFYQSSFKDAICLVIDGSGCFYEQESRQKEFTDFREIESIYYFSEKKSIIPLFKHFSTLNYFSYPPKYISSKPYETLVSDSYGNGKLFSSLCANTGLQNTISESGKLMGLASYGKSTDYSQDWYSNNNGGRTTVNSIIDKHYNDILNNNNFKNASNIAKKLQEESFKHTLYLIKKALNYNKSKNLILSGGYFLNCVNNYKYLKHLPKDINIYIDPLSSDAGTALGGISYLNYLKSNKLVSKSFEKIYLGPQYPKEQLLEGIKKYV